MHNAALEKRDVKLKAMSGEATAARAEATLASTRAATVEKELRVCQAVVASLRNELRDSDDKLQAISSSLGAITEQQQATSSLVTQATAVVRDLVRRIGVVAPTDLTDESDVSAQLRWIAAVGSMACDAVLCFLRDCTRASAEMVFTCLAGCEHLSKLEAADYAALARQAFSTSRNAVRGLS